MCGIVGVLSHDPRRPADGAAVQRMSASLAHRGPDADGFQAEGPVAFGHRRLSIVDLSPEGNQPMSNEDGSVFAVVNGEIYNHQGLRHELERRGHGFRSQSDSEVIVHLYEEHGDALVDLLRGMFAFALWDTRKQRLLLARDRVGKKPLYTFIGKNGFYFASEVRALLAGIDEDARPDLDAIDRYLTLQYVPAPMSGFAGIAKLPAAHTMAVEPGAPTPPRRYWSLSFESRGPVTVEEASAEVRRLLDESVRIRQMADVPLGAFLSGGVDSSAVVALMAESGTAPIKTFSIDFPGTAGETPFARLVARRYGTDHRELMVQPDMTAIVPELARQYGEPFGDSSAVPVYYLSKLTREHVKVALSGDGGDEVFAGYRRYLWHDLSRRIRRLPASLWKLIAAALQRLPWATANQVREFGLQLPRDEAERYLSLIAHFPATGSAQIRGAALREAFAGRADPVLETFARFLDASGTDEVNRLLALDVQTYLPDDILTKVDIASMAHALEVRAPFVDHVLMEYVASLPGSFKLRGWRGKQLLRHAIADLVPTPILRRSKKGFGLPCDQWMRDELRELSRDVLTSRACRERGIIDPHTTLRLLDEQAAGARHGEQLWTLLMLETWFASFIDPPPGKGTPRA